MIRRVVPVALAICLLAAGISRAEEKLKVLLIDGRNNHAWQTTTPVLKAILEESGRFTVEVATAPPKGQDLSGFRPKFEAFDCVMMNYNDNELWPEETRHDFVQYVKNGGGLAIIHAANNAFTGWPEYNDMIGLGWRGNSFGDRITLDDEGNLVRTPKGEGPGAGHGPQHDFPIVVRDTEHPITKGLPRMWMHARDELYHGQRGPAANMRILATAYSANDKGGTGAHEPMIWTIPYGKGRVFTTVMGHSDHAMKCVGFGVVVQRGTEWAATGKVTLTSLPENFPGKEVQLRD